LSQILYKVSNFVLNLRQLFWDGGSSY
jgi:hypothetical protein